MSMVTLVGGGCESGRSGSAAPDGLLILATRLDRSTATRS